MRPPLQKDVLATLRQWLYAKPKDVAAAFATYQRCCKRDGLKKVVSKKTYYSWINKSHASPIEYDQLMALIESSMRQESDLEAFWAQCYKIRLIGKPLAALDSYPVVYDQGRVFLNVDRFEECIQHLLEFKNEWAASDLIYLAERNSVPQRLAEPSAQHYQALLAQVRQDLGFDLGERARQEALEGYKSIVHGFAQTFLGTPMEIVLHDVRNPLHSIVCLQNPISGRRIGDPITNFGLNLIKEYSRHGIVESHISYELKLRDGRKVKSTTIPVFHKSYELIAFICINIEVSTIRSGLETLPLGGGLRRFLEEFVAVSKSKQILEDIENSDYS